jgi:hypothetical protein
MVSAKIREPFSPELDVDIPADSRFFGRPLEAEEMIARKRSMIGHA